MSNHIFISYSRQDPTWLERFKKNLKPYSYTISGLSWDDQEIKPGADWKLEIEKALASAKVAVLLVSSDFLASDFIRTEELPYLLKAAESNRVTIIPVAVRPSVWHVTDLKNKQFANDPNKPLSSLEDAQWESELVKICDKIVDAVHEAVKAQPEPEPAVAADAEAAGGKVSRSVEEKVSRSAEEGLKVLVDLMHSPEVMKRVNSFNTVFQISSRQIERLVSYKDLHDLLHNLQFQCYNNLMSIVRKARKYPDDSSVWNDVVEHEETFEAVIQGLEKATTQSAYNPSVLTWIRKLIEDLKKLFEAVSAKDPEQVIKTGEPIRAILAREPTRLNDRLVEAAENLPLPDLVEALTGVRNSLNGSKVNPVALQKFEEGVSALAALGESLNALVNSHNTWQEIDYDLRRIEGGTNERDYSELTDSWGDVGLKIRGQCEGVEEDWAVNLLKSMTALDGAIESADANLVVLRFQTFRTRAGRRFYQIDYDLKSLCEKLRKVGEPLTTVLEMIQ